MNDEHENDDDYGRPVLPWRRRRPDDPDGPTPDEPRPVPRRRVVRSLFEIVAGWFSLARELPVVLRLLLWGGVVLLAAIIFRTLRGVRR